MEKILEVKKLKVSFRTSGGTVKAVRDISFDLEKGKTLAIVGESGSGKSVTSKAILGILAGNSIVEGGEILYDGKDLLRIDEDEMYKIRGDKISMIFQDPLSSLNPIVKIGKQITEAMLLKNKANRREARATFNGLLALLKASMTKASPDQAAKIAEMVKTFDRFSTEATKLENNYNIVKETVDELIEDMDDFLFQMSKKQKLDVRARLNLYATRLATVKDTFLTAGKDQELSNFVQAMKKYAKEFKAGKPKEGKELPADVEAALQSASSLLKELARLPRPNFFRIGYYKLQNPNADLSGSIEQLNEMTLNYLDEHFMLEFLDLAEKGVELSARTSLEKKKALLPKLEEAKTYFQGDFDKSGALKYVRELSGQVEDAIDRLEIHKDSAAYTFRVGVTGVINQYFAAKANNPKEEARYERQSKKRDALIARGKSVDWKVVPKTVYDLDELKATIVHMVSRLEKHTQQSIAAVEEKDFRAEAVDIVDHLKQTASEFVYRVTRAMAKEKAIKLMDEVGIAEPRMRFDQYPFEFSGGMRQRIVIAIALAANPDILICDEPTTALDVTIQAQILELINKLKAERNLSVIFITHDLGVVANMADDIAVMYAGKIVEYGTADDIFYDPRHPYTWALLASMPDLDTTEKLDAIPGTPPNMIYPPVGDAFAERNKYAMQIDFEMQPPMFEISPTHKAATWLLHPDAPKVETPAIITNRIARMKKAGGAQE